jgi:hypothetical protein
MRGLATGSDEELLRWSKNYLMSIARYYRRDPILWRGFERLCQLLIDNETVDQRRLQLMLSAQVVEQADPEFFEKYKHWISTLNTHAAGARRKQ